MAERTGTRCDGLKTSRRERTLNRAGKPERMKNEDPLLLGIRLPRLLRRRLVLSCLTGSG